MRRVASVVWLSCGPVECLICGCVPPLRSSCPAVAGSKSTRVHCTFCVVCFICAGFVVRLGSAKSCPSRTLSRPRCFSAPTERHLRRRQRAGRILPPLKPSASARCATKKSEASLLSNNPCCRQYHNRLRENLCQRPAPELCISPQEHKSASITSDTSCWVKAVVRASALLTLTP